MKKLLMLLLCLLLAGCAEVYDGPVEEKRVLSSVGTEHYYSIPAPDQTVTTTLWYTTTERYTYDIYGNRAQVREYRDQELVREQRHTFDDRGNLTSTTYIDHTDWIPLPVSYEKHTYDAENRRTSMTHRDRWYREQYRYQFLYEGNRITTTYIADGRESITWSEELLDEQGRLQKDLDSDGSERRYFYDDAGNNIRLEHWAEGVLVRYSEYTYDDRSRMLSNTNWEADGTIRSQLSYSYEDHDYGYNVTQNNHTGTTRVYEYNTLEELITVTVYDSSGAILMQQRYGYDLIEIPKEE